jgi:hypothetical protein
MSLLNTLTNYVSVSPGWLFVQICVNRSGGSQQCCGCLSDSPPPHRHEDLDRGSSASALDVEGTRRSVISMERRIGELRKQVIRRRRESVSDKEREHPLSFCLRFLARRAPERMLCCISLSLMCCLPLEQVFSVSMGSTNLYLSISILLFAARFCKLYIHGLVVALLSPCVHFHSNARHTLRFLGTH